ncbi:MAG: NUDIX hydrolase [Nostoc sp. DedVER02]|uniref:NUDIX hydrolase n=1 Tax=unclassified Nostoc TaxID=2593658 RepID=UPI002AD33343|nr:MULTISPECIES: NUDIX domain-containing protein [unclassified Nostoc]MDZ7985900.1 NUDIX domain-containing protein [Nostoc sp. DedVER02]MDZ8111541.1 NUDIX domain-containing protein [Nostoc sp. DedVER01b]
MSEKDCRKTVIQTGQKVNFVDIGSSFLPAFEKITSVLVVPFTKDGLIVCALLDRGIDLPGGHVQIGELTFEETARREVMEEVKVTLGELKLVKFIQSDFYGSQPEQLTYLVVMTGFVEEIISNNGYNDLSLCTHESMGRHIIDIDEFISQYQAGDKNDMRQIVLDAKSVLFGI